MRRPSSDAPRSPEQATTQVDRVPPGALGPPTHQLGSLPYGAPRPDAAVTKPMGMLPYGHAEPAKTRPMLPAAIAKLLATPAARPLATDTATTREMPAEVDDAARTFGAVARVAPPVRVTMALSDADGVPSEIHQRPPVTFTPPGEPPTDPIERIETLVFPKRRVELPLAPSAAASYPPPAVTYPPNAVPVVAAFAVGSIPPGARPAPRPRPPSPSPYLGSLDASPYPRVPSLRPPSPPPLAASAAQVQQFDATSAHDLALATERRVHAETRAARMHLLAIVLACAATLAIGACVIACL